jgi:signal transduction histidine kinase/CheY-like chemotaxis protein
MSGGSSPASGRPGAEWGAAPFSRTAQSPDDVARLVRITGAIASGVTSGEVFEAVVDYLVDTIGASGASLWLLDDDGKSVRLAHSRGPSEEATRASAIVSLDDEPVAPHLEAIRLREPIWRSSPELRLSCLPLSTPDRVLGVLVVRIEEAGEASEQEKNLLLLVAGYASQAVERLRLLAAESKSRAAASAAATRLEVIGRSSRTFVASSLDHESRLRQVASELAAIFDASIDIRLHSAGGPSTPGEEVSRTIATTGKSVLQGGVIGAPLRVRGGIIGAVIATRRVPGASYTEDDLWLLEELADRAAVAIENSQLYQDALDAQARAERLYGFAQAAAVADGVDQILAAGADAIEALLGTRRTAVLILDAQGVMRFRAWRDLSAEYRAAVEGHSPWPRDAVAPEPVLIDDVERDPAMAPFRALFRSEGIGALAFIPLVASGRLVGKLMVYYDHPRALLAHEVDLARAIGNHLASVVTRFSAVAELEKTVRYNELFAGILAHDLRNPLGAMMMATQLVLDRTEDDRLTNPLHRAVKSGERMRRMIDQLLDFTRARLVGGMELYRRPTSLLHVARHALDEIELGMSDAEVRLEASGDLAGDWDEDRMAQVFSNLAGNAVQHGPPGHPVVVRLDGRMPDQVDIEVANLGVIAPDLLPGLFEPFRSTQHRRNGSSGLGLGLFITREIVRAHRGEIAVTSSEADGTRFRISLPRHATPGEGGERSSDGVPRGSEGTPSGGPVTSGPVLLVDDDLDVREALADLLEHRGFPVITAANGAEALELLRVAAARPSLILLDLMMPVMDGYQFLEEQMCDPDLSDIPVAIITAGQAVDRARVAPAIPVLSKPIDVRRLMTTLRRLRDDRSPS